MQLSCAGLKIKVTNNYRLVITNLLLFEALLKEVCDSDVGHNLPTILVEITATVLDQEVSLLSFFETSIVLISLTSSKISCILI